MKTGGISAAAVACLLLISFLGRHQIAEAKKEEWSWVTKEGGASIIRRDRPGLFRSGARLVDFADQIKNLGGKASDMPTLVKPGNWMTKIKSWNRSRDNQLMLMIFTSLAQKRILMELNFAVKDGVITAWEGNEGIRMWYFPNVRIKTDDIEGSFEVTGAARDSETFAYKLAFHTSSRDIENYPHANPPFAKLKVLATLRITSQTFSATYHFSLFELKSTGNRVAAPRR